MVTSYVEFRSQVSPSMSIILWGCIVLLIGASFMTLVDPNTGMAGRFLVILISALAVPALLWYRFYTLYRLTDTHLLIRSGPMSRSIRLDEIISVKPDRNYSSSPALSFDRFVIRFRRYESVSISPEQRGDFLREVAARAPHLVWEDSYLVSLA